MKKITKQTYLDWYENMFFWRKFEDKLAAVYIQQKVRGFLHLYNGQEAVLAGSLHAMEIGKDRAGTLGPEAAIGRRLQDASPTDEDIMIVKYCWGGSSVVTHWSPTNAESTRDSVWTSTIRPGLALWNLAALMPILTC